ncbi:chromate transporter [Pseudoflavonifractor phocaeensis]|uniref:chromate transporter n=1 Tax=Pseudoflavonifractor phocaeensis TaxID=1870988 RepID=UPI00195E1F59|nr:chromate transporter [Pseudoflavonifractor phocaeensis]MBM6884576.1 chromate transporter [Pseudoflavonifractor phocaeensis]
MKRKKDVLLKVFISTLYLSAFTFGGGYVIVTLMKKKFVDECHWIEEDEMLDLIAIAQSAPGAIAVNGAIVVGYKLAGLLGALTAIVATVIPPFVIISLISVFYHAFRDNFIVSQVLEGMQAGVGAVIASVVYEMAAEVIHGRKLSSIGVMAAAFAATCFLNVNVIYVVVICILIGIIQTFIHRKRGVAA